MTEMDARLCVKAGVQNTLDGSDLSFLGVSFKKGCKVVTFSLLQNSLVHADGLVIFSVYGDCSLGFTYFLEGLMQRHVVVYVQAPNLVPHKEFETHSSLGHDIIDFVQGTREFRADADIDKNSSLRDLHAILEGLSAHGHGLIVRHI